MWQYFNAAGNRTAPRPPTYNTVYSDRHSTVRDLSPLSPEQIEQSDTIFRRRLGALMSVDDLVGAVVDELEAQGLLNNTYVWYTRCV